MRNGELEDRRRRDYKGKNLKFAVKTNWIILKLFNNGKWKELSLLINITSNAT
jgi:hypothetical protein